MEDGMRAANSILWFNLIYVFFHMFIQLYGIGRLPAHFEYVHQTAMDARDGGVLCQTDPSLLPCYQTRLVKSLDDYIIFMTCCTLGSQQVKFLSKPNMGTFTTFKMAVLDPLRCLSQ